MRKIISHFEGRSNVVISVNDFLLFMSTNATSFIIAIQLIKSKDKEISLKALLPVFYHSLTFKSIVEDA